MVGVHEVTMWIILRT